MGRGRGRGERDQQHSNHTGQSSGFVDARRLYRKTMVIDPWSGLKPVKQIKAAEEKMKVGDAMHTTMGAVDPSRAVIEQVEFYFSSSNLRKDAFLQSQMTERGDEGGGWVDLEVIAAFNRVQAFQVSNKELVEILSKSGRLEIREDDQGLHWLRSKPSHSQSSG